MPLLHSIRMLANQAMAPLGFALVRVEKPLPVGELTRVGRFSIRVPASNPLSRLYLKNPGYTAHLGVLAALLEKKYPHLVAMDIGANVGDTACIIKSAADIPLVCIEGDEFTFGFLAQNLRQFQNATAYKLFLGEKTETRGVNLDKGGWNTTLIPSDDVSSQKINLISLDDFLAGQTGVDRYKLVKIDTEGFDCAILRGAKKFLQQVHPVISFEYNRDNMEALGEKGLDTLALLASWGYSQLALHDCDGRFFCATRLADEAFIRNIHDYADGRNAAIYYFDFTLFHADDQDVAQAFVHRESSRRTG